ncbi:Vacuolar protein sorting-associated protein 41 [Cymbomonas tetramitiformis]|uniref:Vacuolar protein sorting-associated protein 41 homolog n=1 Tax=Cymbomonas tetramitiformis TaxID=36881 RepID=A0AAE0F0W1_9CHLO|nr:Vacuolar protein sorting-associated protein 41 [Cymbomonas tetramitiformis]
MEEEEEDEPRLKYQRFGSGSSVPEILANDAASCLCVSPKILALGTHNGNVHLLDFNGNEVKQFAAHSMTVNELCFDSRGEYVGSCSDDGTVVVSALYSEEQNSYEYHRPIKTVALDPDYAIKKSRQIVTGGLAGNLILNSKGWLGNRDHVLHKGEGTIHAVKWCGSLIAWANDAGVKMYDWAANQRITYIDRPRDSPRPELFRAHLHWANEGLLFIGWADCIKIAKVMSRSAVMPAADPGRGRRFQTEYYISGLAPYGDSIIILAYIPEEQGQGEKGKGAMRPEVRLVTYNNEEISTDVLSVHGYEHYKANDYLLSYLHPQGLTPKAASEGQPAGSSAAQWWPEGEEPLYYLVSPKDVVVGRPRDAEDRVQWLLERGRFEEALSTADSNPRLTRRQLYDDVGRAYLEHLLDGKQFERAAALCPRLLKDTTAWERWVFHFAQVHQLPVLSEYIPTEAPVLRDKVYEVVLNAFLPSKSDHPRLLELVRKWPTSLYNIPTVVTAVQRRLASSSAAANATPADTVVLKEVLAELYMADGQRERALGIYLQLQRPGLFDFIEQHKLHGAVSDKAVLLMQLDLERAIDLLVEQAALIPAASVVAQLQEPGQGSAGAGAEGDKEHRYMLHRYLHALFDKDPSEGGDFHSLQVELYAEFEPARLMHFLTSSQFYPLERAYDVCHEHKLVKEMVFILGRMGSTRQALTLIMTELGDIEQAIDFVQGQQDDDLWEELIVHSLEDPKLVGALLERIGLYIDPLVLLRRLSTGVEIPHLRNRLVRILADYRTQTSLRHGCNAILRADCASLAARLHFEARRAVRFEKDFDEAPAAGQGAAPMGGVARCCVCVDPLKPSGPGAPRTSVYFFCSHSYHLRCLSEATGTGGPMHSAQSEATDELQGRKVRPLRNHPLCFCSDVVSLLHGPR